MANFPPRWHPLQIGGLFTPQSYFPRDATTTRPAPVSPAQIEQARREMYQRQMANRLTSIGPTTYINPALREQMAKRQAWREGEDKILNIADKVTMTAVVPYVGEVAAPLGGAVSAGILGARAIRDARAGDLTGAATNAGLGILNGAGAGLMAKMLPTHRRLALPTFANTPGQAAADQGAEWAKTWFRERAKAGMGGLTPSDAGAVAQIKRPVVLPEAYQPPFAKGTLYGLYSPIHKRSAVTPAGVERGMGFVESTTAHEATHEFQSAANASVMQRAYQDIRQIMGNVKAFDKAPASYIEYANNPKEIHARLSEARLALKLRPDEVVTKERLMPHQFILEKKTGIRDLEILAKLFNKLPATAPVIGGAGVGILGLNAQNSQQPR